MVEHRYGQWAGNPKGYPEDTNRCIQEVANTEGWHYHQCFRKRGAGLDCLYCFQHAKLHPTRPQAR